MNNRKECVEAKKGPSKLRKRYFARLVGRCAIFVICIYLFIKDPENLLAVESGHLFEHFSILHILWVIWVIDMFLQLIPVKNRIPLGSQKHFSLHFEPIMDKINHHALRRYIIETTQAAYKVFIIWFAVILAIGVLYRYGILTEEHLFLITVFFYVCDLICVLIWCPFRLIMKNKCCTTCRIFNWDHLMMFTPMLFINSFYSISLLLVAFVVWVVWELCVMLYPERFWENTNAALQCSNCTDKLCTQYCRKLKV